ncbi:MAG: hypothetical protein DDT31_00686 [Syntrophomonadaceae bacterium]|nr:hypothetical protein [Bacillota bacterium]
MAKITVPVLPITTCPEGAGSINVPGGNTPPMVPNPYVAPELCVGDFTITQGECATIENQFQESLAAENLNISGSPLNIFKLLGVHEQGRLIDLIGHGEPISSSANAANAFDALAAEWASDETGIAVTRTPSYIGYDFGVRLTSYGQDENAPGIADAQHITSIRITQGPDPETRVRQIRIERSNGDYKIEPTQVIFSGAGNGALGKFYAGVASKPGMFMVSAINEIQFLITFINSAGSQILGVANVGAQFNSLLGSFTISAGTVPFAVGDLFTAPVSLAWYRVDVVNIPDVPTALIALKQSSSARYWRIVPLVFAGAMTDKPWVISKLEMFDFQSTRLDNIQDTLYMENRDRDYANASIQLKVAYQPFDGMNDMSKFGFQIADVYTFTTSFATMVTALGRPIVVGDVIELPPEMQYDHNLRPVRKFLEVNDVAWSAEGYTTGWKPVMYRFTAQQLIPSQEHRDILGTADTQKYVVDDGSFFAGIEQIQTAPLTTTEANQADAVQAVPEKGTNVREAASGTNRFNHPGTYDGVGPYTEDGLPPDGLPYTEGFKLPDVSAASDGDYFRLNYDPKLHIAARLYKFSSIKNKWIYVETDRRNQRSAHKPTQLAILNLSETRPLTGKL